MKVLLLQLDGKLPNIALMRIAAHCRPYAGEIAFRHCPTVKVVEASDWWGFDRIYASLIFERTRRVAEALLQKYRFAEGAAYQRTALAFDAKYLPASVQLAQDLLRLGREEEGWKLAAEAHQEDGYHVANFNLLELKDRIAKFKTLENESFIVRMEAKEAAVYGPRVLRLLDRAKQTLCDKYELDLKDRITVEIFPDETAAMKKF